MSIYVVTNKETGEEVTRYCSSQVVERINDVDLPLSEFDHTECDENAPVVKTTVFNGRRILTKLEFRSLFSDATIKWIDRFESQFETLVYLTDDQKDDIRTAFANYHEATGVNLDDPRWPPGLGLYVALGGMDATEVTEVLNG